MQLIISLAADGLTGRGRRVSVKPPWLGVVIGAIELGGSSEDQRVGPRCETPIFYRKIGLKAEAKIRPKMRVQPEI
jgi:hypothetical protein